MVCWACEPDLHPPETSSISSRNSNSPSTSWQGWRRTSMTPTHLNSSTSCLPPWVSSSRPAKILATEPPTLPPRSSHHCWTVRPRTCSPTVWRLASLCSGCLSVRRGPLAGKDTKKWWIMNYYLNFFLTLIYKILNPIPTSNMWIFSAYRKITKEVFHTTHSYLLPYPSFCLTSQFHEFILDEIFNIIYSYSCLKKYNLWWDGIFHTTHAYSCIPNYP